MNSNLSYMLSRVQSVSTQTFRLQPQNSTSATPGQQIRLSLPSNTLLSTRSIKLLFKVATAGGGARLPAKIDSLIDRVTLEVGGVTIDGGNLNNYGVLRHAKDALMGSHTDPVLSHPEMVRQKSYHNAAAITGTNPETYAADGDDFAICFWEGFLGSCAPSIIDTSLLPDLVLVIQLAGNEVLSSVSGVTFAEYVVANGAPNASFSLSNIRMTCECLGLGSGVYDQLVSRAISERGMLEVPFLQYFSTLDTHNGSSRFHVSSACLDRIYAVFRAGGVNGFNKQGAPVAVAGYKRAGCFTSPASIAATNGSAGAVTQDIGLPQYEIGGVLRTNGEKYLGKFHNFTLASNATAQFQLNGTLTPGFPATVPELYAMSKNAVDSYGEPEVHTLDQYRSHYGVICHRLSLPGGGTRELAGVDTRGISLQGSLNTTNMPADSNCLIFFECTSVLQIGAGKQFSVVV